jgi:hypothetical protein
MLTYAAVADIGVPSAVLDERGPGSLQVVCSLYLLYLLYWYKSTNTDT